MKQEPGYFSRNYTVILFCYGCLSLLLAAGLNGVISNPEGKIQPSILFNVQIHLLFGGAAILVGLLRLLKGAASLPASTALSIALALELPIGTALFLYWLTRVRSRERALQLGPPRVRWYTEGLFIAALGFSLSVLAFRLVVLSGGSNEILEVLASVYVGVSVLLAAVGTARCVSPRWGYFATFGLSVVLIPLVPIGTIASLLWFLMVRKYDQELVSKRDA